MKKILWRTGAALVVFALALAANVLQSPDSDLKAKDREVIKECWDESKAKGTSISPAKQQNIVSACEMLEKVYRMNYGTDS